MQFYNMCYCGAVVKFNIIDITVIRVRNVHVMVLKIIKICTYTCNILYIQRLINALNIMCLKIFIRRYVI